MRLRTQKDVKLCREQYCSTILIMLVKTDVDDAGNLNSLYTLDAEGDPYRAVTHCNAHN